MTTKFEFVNSKIENCGVYQFGKRVSKILKQEDLNFNYNECNSLSDFKDLNLKSKNLIFNYIKAGRDNSPLGWLNNNILSNLRSSKYSLITIGHLNDVKLKFDNILSQNPDQNQNNLKNIWAMPRPLPYDLKNTPFKKININFKKKIRIGSFGLADESKGFAELISGINENYTNIDFNFHITSSYYSDPSKLKMNKIINDCKSILLKKNNNLTINSNFLSNKMLINFLNSNDINIFNYLETEDDDGGISSVIDYAISSRKPFAVSKASLFKHISKELVFNFKNLEDILSYKSDFCDKYMTKWSHGELKRFFENFIDSL